MSKYKQKYINYKIKYLKLKKEVNTLLNSEYKYGIGKFEMDGINYKSLKTDDGKFFSYYDKSIGELKEYQKTKNLKKKDPTKVLIIDDINLFDIFTNKYGKLNRNKIIYIQWDKVSEDYGGFYLESNNDLRQARHLFAVLNKQRYQSWWKYEYKYSTVMVFNTIK